MIDKITTKNTENNKRLFIEKYGVKFDMACE